MKAKLQQELFNHMSDNHNVLLMDDDFNCIDEIFKDSGEAKENQTQMPDLLQEYTDFLLKKGYCDTDVYAEPPTAIDQFLEKKGYLRAKNNS